MSMFSNVFASDAGTDNAQVGPSPEPVLPEDDGPDPSEMEPVAGSDDAEASPTPSESASYDIE